MRKYKGLIILTVSIFFIVCLYQNSTTMIKASEMISAETLTTGEELIEKPALESEDWIKITIIEKINEDMPALLFEIYADYSEDEKSYAVQKIVIRDNTTNVMMQELSIPELTLFGQTNIHDSNFETLGLTFEDLNFDGYKDIRLYDTTNGNYRIEWLYFVWNPKTGLFVHDERLSRISLASFDQTEKLIYGMVRGSAVHHIYYTYQYWEEEPILIRVIETKGLLLDNDVVKGYLALASIDTDISEFFVYYRVEQNKNDKTLELETITEQYEIYRETDDYIYREEDCIVKINADSEIGQMICNDLSGR